MDQQLLTRIARTLEQLQCRLCLLDENGVCLVPESDETYQLPPNCGENEIALFHGTRFLHLPRGGFLCAPQDAPDDIMLVTGQLVDALQTLSSSSGGISGAYQRMLLNDLSVAELDAVLSEYRIPAELNRCVLVLHMVQVQGRTARDILGEIIPLSASDVLIGMDNHTAALIKCTTGIEDIEDLRQFAAALQETVLGETGLSLTIGIGEAARSAGELHQSYRQARRAIEIGRIYREEETIHVYSSLLLERFLSDISPDIAAHYHSLLFNRHTARLFSDEILYTIEMFFRKDLNLSDTARQLYIHRNTLVYRLDKVQRQIGLDLRKFDDAVTFKMLMEMKKCAANKNKKTL